MRTTSQTIRIAGMAFAISVLALAGSASARNTKFDRKSNERGIRISYAYNVSQGHYHPMETAWFFRTSRNPISFSYDSSAGVW